MSSCSNPLGIKNGRLSNSKITASSEYNKHHAAWLGRLGRTRRGSYVGAWCARHNNHNQWIKFDFSRPMKVTKVDTQGRQDADQWVTRFQLYSSLDGIHWQIYRFNSQDKVRRLRGNLYCKVTLYNLLEIIWNQYVTYSLEIAVLKLEKFHLKF